MEPTSISQKYVRKPLYVDGVQITEENFADVARWCFGEVCNSDETPIDHTKPVSPATQYIKVRGVRNPRVSRHTKAYVGDWILYTDRGYKVYNNLAFQANFEAVPVDQAEAA